MELFGKFPANFKFLEGLNKNPIINKINKIAGFEAFRKIEEGEDSVSLYAIDILKINNLPDDIKNKIKAEFNKKINLR